MKRIVLALILIGCSHVDIDKPYRQETDTTHTRVVKNKEEPKPIVFEVTIGEWEEIDINI